MKKYSLVILVSLFLGACQQKDDLKKLQDDTIKIHDEIMPEIAKFDQDGLKIDSLLSSLKQLKETHKDLDTNATKTEFSGLKAKLENATDEMMTWMKDYQPDSLSKTYHEEELQKIKNLKKSFDEVKALSSKTLIY